jgi:hypothetical protein
MMMEGANLKFDPHPHECYIASLEEVLPTRRVEVVVNGSARANER